MVTPRYEARSLGPRRDAGEHNRHPILENHPAPFTQLSQKISVEMKNSLICQGQNLLAHLAAVILDSEVDRLGHISLGEPGGLTSRQDVGAALFLQVDVGERGDGGAAVFGEVLRVLADGAGPGREALFGNGPFDRAQLVGRRLAGAQEGALGGVRAALFRGNADLVARAEHDGAAGGAQDDQGALEGDQLLRLIHGESQLGLGAQDRAKHFFKEYRCNREFGLGY